MYAIENITLFRANVVEKINIIIEDLKNSKNIEKSIYNYTIQQAIQKKLVRKWDNVYFVHLYVDKLRSVFMNIKHPELTAKIKTNKILAQEVAFLTHQQLMPDKWDPLVEAKKVRDKNKYTPIIQPSTEDFTCKCGSKRCIHSQAQTRSADESMTTYVTCLDCHNRWKC